MTKVKFELNEQEFELLRNLVIVRRCRGSQYSRMVMNGIYEQLKLVDRVCELSLCEDGIGFICVELKNRLYSSCSDFAYKTYRKLLDQLIEL